MQQRARHQWVDSRKGKIGFALQAVAAHSSGHQGAALIRAGEHAERYGFDGFFLGDHPAWAPECWLHLSIVATRTERIRLGQLVAASPYRAPLLTARLQADLDRLSNGRSILGLGIGWNASDYGLGVSEFDRMGLAYPDVAARQAALEEALTIVHGVWGNEPFTFSGAHYRASDAQVDPPVQAGGVPLVIAGGGTRTLHQLARLGDIANLGPGPAGRVETASDARQRLAVLQTTCDSIGRPYDDILRSHFTHWLVMAKDTAAVAAKAARYFPDGLDAFWGKYLVAGTPDTVAQHYQEYVDAGIEYFIVQTLDPDDEETIAMVMSELAPRLQSASLS